jgi:hypothetical protein
MTDDAAERHAVDLHTDRPHPARVYDYLLGGKDNFEADRVAAEQGIKANPNSRIPPPENRAFLRRAVRYLAAEAGIRQFLDIAPAFPPRPTCTRWRSRSRRTPGSSTSTTTRWSWPMRGPC